MASKISLIITVLLFANVTLVHCQDPDYNFTGEAQCIAARGTCTLATKCPHEFKKEDLGLCPKQQSKGAECCKQIPPHLINRCKTYGGECIPDCPEPIREARGTDCPSDRPYCCVWLI